VTHHEDEFFRPNAQNGVPRTAPQPVRGVHFHAGTSFWSYTFWIQSTSASTND